MSGAMWVEDPSDWSIERHDEVLQVIRTGRCTCGRPYGHDRPVASTSGLAPVVEEARVSIALPPPGEARTIRERARISQERLGAELGVHRVTVGRWEAGIRRPRGRVLQRYAELLDQLQKVVDGHQERAS